MASYNVILMVGVVGTALIFVSPPFHGRVGNLTSKVSLLIRDQVNIPAYMYARFFFLSVWPFLKSGGQSDAVMCVITCCM